MGANSTQAVAIVLFLVGFTLLAGGLAGGGFILWVAALALIIAAAFFFMKCKAVGAQTNSRPAAINPERGDEAMIIAGIVITLLGFLISVASLGMMSSVEGRMVMVLVGIAVSLVGIIGVLNRAFHEQGDLEEINPMKKSTLLLGLILILGLAPLGVAQTPAPRHRRRCCAAAARPLRPVPITDADLKAIPSPMPRRAPTAIRTAA